MDWTSATADIDTEIVHVQSALRIQLQTLVGEVWVGWVHRLYSRVLTSLANLAAITSTATFADL